MVSSRMNRTLPINSTTACHLAVAVALLIFGSQRTLAADAPAANVPPLRTTLPEAHEYQQQLRKFMATLKAQDFEHGVTGPLIPQPGIKDPEVRYRDFIFTLMGQPLVGSKRGAPAVNAPPRLFTLEGIETPAGVMRTPIYPEAVISLTEWNYPGNVYRGNRGLRLRAFVAASVNMMMLDDFLDRTPTACRSDSIAYQLIHIGAPYSGFKELIPADVQAAYETGLKKLARRIIGWGPKGEEAHLDLVAPVGLWYASQACHDAALTRDVEAYARVLFTDPRYFHPAGYFVGRGGFDAGFAGSCNFFTAWAALGAEWPFAREALERTYRLRAHLILPEPDGKWTGPTHFNTRLSSPASIDQWEWGKMRDVCASLVTDEAAHLVTLPEADVLAKAGAMRAAAFNGQIAENPVKTGNGSSATPYAYFKNDEISSIPWAWRLWASYNFPATLNFGHDLYPAGAFAHRRKLEQEHSPLLKSPFLRDGTFVRDFEKVFTVAKMPGYAAIVHTGPVGDQSADDGFVQYKGPLGLGGGQLSAFWTPATGSVILGRRGGMTRDKTFDDPAQWRLWPIHAVSGCAADGRPFTSARIIRPAVTSEISATGATVTASGIIPAEQLGQTKLLEGRIDFTRTFKLEPDGVTVATRIKGDGHDKLAELYETLPVFLRDPSIQPSATPAVIEIEAGAGSTPATDQWHERVTAVKLSRFDGAVRIIFDKPRRVKLSPADWTDPWFTKATCRNILIDLLDNKDQPGSVKEASVSYRLQPAPK